jgi:hypothetical protein
MTGVAAPPALINSSEGNQTAGGRLETRTGNAQAPQPPAFPSESPANSLAGLFRVYRAQRANEVVMTKIWVIAAVLMGGVGLAVAQDQVPPGNKSEAATPAPPAQQNAPPDKVAPGRVPSPNAVPPDDRAESNTPALKMDAGTDKKSPTAK